MSAKLEKRIAEIQARIAAIAKERVELERAPDRAERQLAEAQAEEDRLSADIRAQAHGSSAEDLAAAMRETAALKATLDKLGRETGPKLEKLSAEKNRLREDLTRTNREIAKVRLSDAVMRYEAALRQALPIVDEIRVHASAAGVALPPRSWDEQSVLIERGVHMAGGITITLR
jgi:septal ring factor EnvC (AmiA/AmiB activator)